MGSIKATNNVVRFDYGKVKGKLSSFAFNTVWRNGLLNRYVYESLQKKVTFFPLTKIQTAHLYIQIKTC